MQEYWTVWYKDTPWKLPQSHALSAHMEMLPTLLCCIPYLSHWAGAIFESVTDACIDLRHSVLYLRWHLALGGFCQHLFGGGEKRCSFCQIQNGKVMLMSSCSSPFAFHSQVRFTVPDITVSANEFVFEFMCWISVKCGKWDGKSSFCTGAACWPSFIVHFATSALCLVLTTATTASCQSSPRLQGLLKKLCIWCLNATSCAVDCGHVKQ